MAAVVYILRLINTVLFGWELWVGENKQFHGLKRSVN